MSDIPISPKEKERSLRLSLWKGACGTCTTGFTQEYFTPFLLYLGGQSSHVGILSALNNLFSSLIQLFSAEVLQRFRSRKTMVVVFGSLQVAALTLIAVLAWRAMSYWLLIVLVVLSTSFGAVFIPAWLSFLSDLVTEKRRGDYFGWRSRTLGMIAVTAMVASGTILHFTEDVNPAAGFVVIFTIAAMTRLLSLVFLRRMTEPPLQYKKEDSFTFWQFFRRIKESNFAKFVVFVAVMNFSVSLASPFFAVLMIRDLQFNYLLYTAVIMAAPLMLYLTVRRWGLHADRVGSLKIMKMTSRLIAIVPLLWVLNQYPLYLIGVEMFSGFLWAGFNLCTATFIYDAVSPEKRARCIAYFNVVNGFALSCGALIGGFLVKSLPPVLGFNILTLFLLSSAARMCVSLIFPRLLKEVRTVENVKSIDLFFSMISMRPVLGVDRNTARVQN